MRKKKRKKSEEENGEYESVRESLLDGTMMNGPKPDKKKKKKVRKRKWKI